MAASRILTLEDALAEAESAIEALYQSESGPLWPAPYDQDTPEAAFRFITECWWTHNEADQSISLVPKEEFVEWVCHLWHQGYSTRTPMVLEKSRRMIVSWICRGLECWAMGLKRGETLIIDQKHENSAEHLWRVYHGYTELCARRPELNLKPCKNLGNALVKAVTHVVLPNGSILTQSHQEAGATQGKGKTIVTLEEISKYRAPREFWAQALIVTQGSAEGSGGWVNGICNASPNPDWREIKCNRNGREFLGLD